jgi:hypothetical protein
MHSYSDCVIVIQSTSIKVVPRCRNLGMVNMDRQRLLANILKHLDWACIIMDITTGSL